MLSSTRRSHTVWDNIYDASTCQLARFYVVLSPRPCWSFHLFHRYVVCNPFFTNRIGLHCMHNTPRNVSTTSTLTSSNIPKWFKTKTTCIWDHLLKLKIVDNCTRNASPPMNHLSMCFIEYQILNTSRVLNKYPQYLCFYKPVMIFFILSRLDSSNVFENKTQLLNCIRICSEQYRQYVRSYVIAFF